MIRPAPLAILLFALVATSCREYTPVAAEIRRELAPSADEPTEPAPTVSASTQTSAPPPP